MPGAAHSWPFLRWLAAYFFASLRVMTLSRRLEVGFLVKPGSFPHGAKYFSYPLGIACAGL
jgi:hypothetical protein